jgi:Mat/Ecp fimbriae outer membrane usher protein
MGRLFLLIIILWGLCDPAFATINIVDGTPDGFEQLNTPKPSMISLYYGGDFLGNFPIHMTPATIQFDDAEAILNLIPNIDLKNDLMTASRHPLPVNADLLCSEKRTQDCGILDPEIIGIIFNEASLSGELFINKNYLSISNQDGTRYLPLPEKNLSSIYMFNGAVNGADQSDMNYNLANNAVFAYGEKKLVVQSSVADQGLRFDSMKASVERRGWETGTGLFRSHPMQLVGDTDMAGVSIGTSMRTVLDKNKMQGNDIILYIPRRSFVSIYRDGRLYSSRAYEAGNQVIDTSDLPEGAYTITLRIQEVDGATREETRFFAKNQEIPPAGHPLYFAEGGVIRQAAFNDDTLPQLSSKPIVRAGTVRRLNDTMGLGISGTGVSDRVAMESGIYWIRSTTQLRMTGLASTKGDMGLNANYFYNKKQLSGSIDIRQVWAEPHSDIEYQNLFTDIKQVSSMIAYAIQPDITVGGRASYSDQQTFPSSITIGPYAQWRIWQHGESSLELNADIARSNNQTQGDMMIRFTHRLGDYGISGTAGNRFGSQASPIGSARAWYQKNTPGEYIQVGAGISGDSDNQTLSGDGDWRNHFGQIHGSVQQSVGHTGSGLGYGGNFSFNAAQRDRDIYIGGNQSDMAAMVIKTKGDTNAVMNIFVNGSLQSTVRVGEEQVLYLTPFHTYRIRLAPQTPSLIDFDGNNRQVTLYSGNVGSSEWVINNFYVVSARIVDENGYALSDALLQESRVQNATNDTGRIQAELSNPDQLHFVKPDGTQCLVSLPKNTVPINGVLLYKNDLKCITQTSSQ